MGGGLAGAERVQAAQLCGACRMLRNTPLGCRSNPCMEHANVQVCRSGPECFCVTSPSSFAPCPFVRPQSRSIYLPTLPPSFPDFPHISLSNSPSATRRLLSSSSSKDCWLYSLASYALPATPSSLPVFPAALSHSNRATPPRRVLRCAPVRREEYQVRRRG